MVLLLHFSYSRVFTRKETNGIFVETVHIWNNISTNTFVISQPALSTPHALTQPTA